MTAIDDTTGWELAIFDCDGVLVDSEVITHQVMIDALAELGLDLNLDEAFDLFIGNTLAENVAIIESRLGAPLPGNFFAEWRERLYQTFHDVPVRAVPGIEDVLERIQVPSCVVSNGPFRKMRTTLGVTGLLPRFEDLLFSPESGVAGKPAPDLFLAAAERFGADPAAVFVVEDSPKGVAGAVAAGMTVFGFVGGPYVNAAELEAAGAKTFDDMRDLTALLSEYGPARRR